MARKAKPVPNRAPVPERVDSVPPPEVVTVRSRRVACDGVGGALGHPKVWLEMGADGFVECGYCDRRFVLASDSEGVASEQLAPGVYVGSHGH
jgi:uncharacterized Zn-finger protein